MNTDDLKNETPADAKPVLADGLTFSFDEGALWEDYPFEIKTGDIIESDKQPCKHCSLIGEETKYSYDKTYNWIERKWKCPTVVILLNEGGYNSTGLCLDCLLGAVKKLNIR